MSLQPMSIAWRPASPTWSERSAISILRSRSGRVRRDLQAALTAVKDRLKSLRLAGADLTDEMTQSFTQAFERLRAAVAEARSEFARA